jgi:hypothetical protein
MKKLLSVLGYVCLVLALSLNARAQNLTTVSAANITDINGAKLASGQLCFLVTDQQDNPISVSIGGGGQALRRGYCSPVAAGVVTGFTVPNPGSTQPAGIYYRVTVKDSSTGQEVLRYTQVSFTGATFNFDNYAPQNLGNAAPLSGNSVTGNLSVTGNVAATGTVSAANIPGTIPGTGACTNQFVTALNSAAAPTCSNSIAGAFSVTGSANLGTTGTNGQTAGGFGTPSAIRHYCGDGTGWRCEFARRSASVDTIVASISDAGVMNTAGGYMAAGTAAAGHVLRGNGSVFLDAQLAASDLSNGASGTGSVCLTTSCSMSTPGISSPSTTGTDSGAETLSNKTLQGTGSGNKVTLLNSQDPLSNLVGNGTDQVVYQFTIPANTIQAGKGFRLTYHGFNNNAASVTYKVIVGSTTLFSFPVTAATNNHRVVVECFNNQGTQSTQTSILWILDQSAAGDGSVTSTEIFSNAVTVKITANEASPNSISPKKFFIEVIQ